MMQLFNTDATVPHRNPLSPCTRCGKAWGTLYCAADWCCDKAIPEVFLMAVHQDGSIECSKCWHLRMATYGLEWAREVTWIDALRSYLHHIGAIR